MIDEKVGLVKLWIVMVKENWASVQFYGFPLENHKITQPGAIIERTFYDSNVGCI
jgi:hypothetical protein